MVVEGKESGVGVMKRLYDTKPQTIFAWGLVLRVAIIYEGNSCDMRSARKSLSND